MNHHPLGSLSASSFLEEHWQKIPLLMRQGFPNFKSPLSANELAGLALEQDVESRIILENGATPWELRHGPFSEHDFASLPDTHWTLLVQAVDHRVPEIHQILEQFSFLPSWRLDDIMISYAADQGSVGAHYDAYDVFLIQAQGRRRWQIGSVYDESSPKVKNTDLHILSDFEALEEHVLEPGDILYLPPGVGHHGVAEGECITISVGFRAPSHRDILMQFTDFVADKLPEKFRYSDPDLQPASRPAQIDEQSIDRLQAILLKYCENRALLSQWFGEHMTLPKYPLPESPPISNWLDVLSQHSKNDLHVNESSRLAFYKEELNVTAFTDGHLFTSTSASFEELFHQLCKDKTIPAKQWCSITDQDSQQWLMQLLSQGSLYS